MGGPSVDQGAVNQEQQNQTQAQNYAAQQQQQALAGVNAWTAANKPPGQSAAPLQMPGASSPATMGGGNIPAGAGAARPPQGPAPQGVTPAPQPGRPVAPPGGNVALNPAQKAHIMALIGGQGGR